MFRCTKIRRTKRHPKATYGMKEIVIISGKGGTKRASLLLCVVCSDKAVLADCDVDAADLHLILKPVIRNRTEFAAGTRQLRTRQWLWKRPELPLKRCVIKQPGTNFPASFTIDPGVKDAVCARFILPSYRLQRRNLRRMVYSDTALDRYSCKLGIASENSEN